MSYTVESVTESLFREYLHRNNLRASLEAFEKEVPRTAQSISNRLELAKSLKILKLIKANKHREKPFVSMAEMIVADMMTKAGLKSADIVIEEKRHHGELNPEGLMIKGTFSLSKTNIHKTKSTHQKSEHLVAKTSPPQGKETRSGSHKSKTRYHSSFSGKTSSPIHEKEPLMVVGSCQHSNTNTSPRPPSRQKNSYSEFETLPEKHETVTVAKHGKKTDNLSFTCPPVSHGDLLEFIDIENDIHDDVDTTKLRLSNRALKPLSSAASVVDITAENAIELREIIFGNANSLSFNAEWMKQSFIFNDANNLEFGLVQHKGGPCGVLAVVQAFIVKYLLTESCFIFSPSNSQRQNILCKSLSHILWQAANYQGSSKVAYVCSNSGRSKVGPSLRYRCDGITEKLQIYKCTSLQETEATIQTNLPQYQNFNGGGCILFLYSAILSRGVQNIRGDMDDPGSILMANHGYCGQEMVNLLSAGYAAQNVFNNVIDLDGKALKGIREPRDIGLLTLYEYYKVFEVGSFLKNPSTGIWIICSESHYSVLFCTDDKYDPDSVTELVYYDSLGNQEAPYYLTVYPNSGVVSSDDDPPLELCIRSRWNASRIDWNGSDPLL